MVISALDIVDRCYSNEDGDAVCAALKPYVLAGEAVTLSFAGVTSVTSSFVNSALIALLDSVAVADLKRTLRIADPAPAVAQVVCRRFAQEAALHTGD